MNPDPALPPAARPLVLLVDDEPELLSVLAELLAVEFEVVTAGNTAEAELQLAQRPFELIICDHLMPRETGLDFLLRIRDCWPQTKRILLTGYMNPELISRSVPVADLVCCVLKPTSGTELLAIVRSALAR